MLGDYLERHPFPGLKLYKVFFRKKGEPYDGNPDHEEVEPFNLADANCLSSEIVGMPAHHKVVLDLDGPCRLIPSTTEGHFHLIIDKTLTWHQYESLLWSLANVGIIEEGYYQAAKSREATFIRLPWIKKEEGE